MRKNINKVVLITGAAKRLGKKIAIALASNKFDLVIHYNKSKEDANKLASELRRTYNIKTSTFKADLRDTKQIEKLINSVYNEYKRLDVLINNASVFLPSKLKNTSEVLWDNTLDTNLKSIFFLSKCASEKMFRHKEGIIINIASLGGLKPFANHIAYSVSKAGVIMLTKCLAKALGPKIRVIAIAPGTIKFGEEKLNAEKNLLKSYTTSTEISKLVLALINDYKHITGECIAIESGNLLI